MTAEELYLRLYARAKNNPTSLRLAVTAKCWDCQGRGADPKTQWRIGNCEITDCPLHHIRPYRKLDGTPMPVTIRKWEMGEEER